MKLIAEEVQKLTKLNLFGVDIIISKDEDDISQYLVVDVNYFPSYKEVQDLPRKLQEFLWTLYERQKANSLEGDEIK